MSGRLLVATRKGLFDVRRRGAGDWRIARSAFLGVPVSMVLSDSRSSSIYAALDHGHFGCKLHRSDDDGETWNEIATPSYESIGGDPAPSLKMIWALEAAGDDQPDVLWAGTIPGGLFRSDDRGTSWQLNHALWNEPRRSEWFGGGAEQPGIHSVCIDPRDSRKIAVAVSCGGVWQTPDGGESWELGGKGLWAEYVPPDQTHNPAIQDVHRLTFCAASPDTMWIQHHNGVFRSTSGFSQWREIENIKPSNFGFAVAAHPRDPDTAWFVPALDDSARYPVDGRVVVTRTRDGGRSFEVLAEGLPQQNAFDLVYRHGLDVDETGECLAMGSTTGGFWISESAGDDWVNVTSYLPPIYAVRFA